MNKEQLIKIVKATQLKPLANKYKVTLTKLYNIRFCYKQIIKGNYSEAKKRLGSVYPLLKELANENTDNQGTGEAGKIIIKTQSVTLGNNGKVKLPDFDFDQLDKLVDDFKLNLASIMANLIKKIVAEETKTEIERNKNKWRVEGALEEQAKFVEASKKDNLADMLQKKLSGAV